MARGPERPRRTPRRFKSSHNAALASQFRYNVSPGAGKPARRGRGSRGASTVTRAPGRGGRPRTAPLARSARGAAKGRSRRPPGPAPGPAPDPEGPAAGASRPPTALPALAGAPHRASRPAPRPVSLARPRERRRRRRWGRLLPGAPPLPARARTLPQPRQGRPHSPSAAGEVRGEGAPGPPSGAGRAARRAPGKEARGAARLGTGAGRPPGSGRHRVPSALVGPAGRPAGAAQLRN